MAKRFMLSVGYHHVRSEIIVRKEFGLIKGTKAGETTVTILQELLKKMKPIKGRRPRDPVFMVKASKVQPVAGSDDNETFEAAIDWIMENFHI